MRRAALIVLGAFISINSALAADGDEAMFGLRWGMTIAQVKALGTPLTKVRGDRNMEIYKTESVPRPLSDGESYTMIFADGKLAKVAAVTRNITGDPSGREGKDRFEAIKSSLQDKYGAPTMQKQTSGNKLYRDYDEFYQCLRYTGCGTWFALYETADKVVMIELKGVSRGTGYLDISAEANPQWSDALKIYKGRKTESDKDAL
jgi:hypothetical protein